VEYKNALNNWVTLGTFNGGGTPGQIYRPVYNISGNAIHMTFQLRFRQIKGNMDCDYWHIDDIQIFLSNPTLLSTTPMNNETNVPINESIIMRFSKSINENTFSFSCTPNPGGWNTIWNGTSSQVMLTHRDFLSDTIYEINITHAEDLIGNPLVSHLIETKWTFETKIDKINPFIKSISPINGATMVDLNERIRVNFSEPIKQNSLSFICSPDPGGWSASWFIGNTSLELTHSPFIESTRYEFTISKAKDLTGKLLNDTIFSNHWYFITEDLTRPYIIHTLPEGNSSNVDLNQEIIITFSEPIVQNSVIFTCTPNPGNWQASWSNDNKTLSLVHDPFKENSGYLFRVTFAQDLTGNILASHTVPNPWVFTTLSLRPNIISTSPENGTVNVPIDQKISVTFNYDMIKTSVESAFSISPEIGGIFEWNNNRTLTFRPEQNLSYITKYTVIIGNTITNIFNYSMLNDYKWEFTTVRDMISPVILSYSPVNGTTNVSITSEIRILFNEPMNKFSVENNTSINPTIDYSSSWIENELIINPTKNLSYNCKYVIILSQGIKDFSGNTLNPTFSWEFTTEADYISPEVIERFPVGSNIPITSSITVTFNEPMLESSLKLELKNGATQLPVFGSLSYNSSKNQLIFSPTNYLFYNTNYSINVEGTDLGYNLLGNVEWSFITEKTPSDPNFDSDNDSIPDIWELEHDFMNPYDPSDAISDYDKDGCKNVEEYLQGTDPAKSDTDEDGMPDGWEIKNNLNPLINDANMDSDQDGFTNLEEYQEHSDPNNPKSFPEEKKWLNQSVLIIIIAFVFILLIVIVVILMMKKKKTPKENKKKISKTEKNITIECRRCRHDIGVPRSRKKYPFIAQCSKCGARGRLKEPPEVIQEDEPEEDWVDMKVEEVYEEEDWSDINEEYDIEDDDWSDINQGMEGKEE